jgi:cholesterol transport system auxiliary component
MMRALLRLAVLGACAAALSGCISLLPKSKPAQLYRFGPVPATGAPAVSAKPGGVAIFRTNGSFPNEAADDRILTVDGGKMAYIAQSRWVAPAPVLFDEAVGQAYDASPVRLVVRGQQGRYAYALRLDVRNFEARYPAGPDSTPTVVVRVHAALSRADQSIAGEQIFESSVPASANRVGAIVGAYDQAVKDVLAQLVAWTQRTAT